MAKQIKIGVFVPAEVQLLDLACVDLFHMMSAEYLANLTLIPKHVAALAPSVAIYYIGSPGTERLPLTADITIVPTHDYAHPDVRPGTLDVVLVPGPDPGRTPAAAASAFLRAHADSPGTDVLSVCTGVYLCGYAGILEGGRVASGPRGLQGELKKKFPGVRLVGEEMRWARDGNYWSSGGVTNGNDMVAAYARSSEKFPSPVVEIALKMADVGNRGDTYGEGQAAFTLGVVWQLLRAWFGVGKTKRS